MLGLNKREGRIFRYALVGHGGLACLLFVFGLLPSCEEDPEVVHVELSIRLLRPLPSPLLQVTPQPTLPNPFPTAQTFGHATTSAQATAQTTAQTCGHATPPV